MKTFQYTYNYDIDKELYNFIIKHAMFNSAKQEKIIFKKLVEHKTCKVIAQETGLSERTIQRRRGEIYDKIEQYLPSELKIDKHLRTNYKKPRPTISVRKPTFVVYILIFPNNKVYIGQTFDTKTRWCSNGIGYKQNKEMYKDIQEYGWENITKRIIFKNLTLQQSLDKEKEMIIHYKSNIPKYGYNKNF